MPHCGSAVHVPESEDSRCHFTPHRESLTTDLSSAWHAPERALASTAGVRSMRNAQVGGVADAPRDLAWPPAVAVCHARLLSGAV